MAAPRLSPRLSAPRGSHPRTCRRLRTQEEPGCKPYPASCPRMKIAVISKT